MPETSFCQTGLLTKVKVGLRAGRVRSRRRAGHGLQTDRL